MLWSCNFQDVAVYSKSMMMVTLASFPPFWRRRILIRIAKGDENNNFLFLWQFYDLSYLVVVKEAYDYGAKTRMMGCKTEILGCKSQIIHEPVSKFCGTTILVITGFFQYATDDQ